MSPIAQQQWWPWETAKRSRSCTKLHHLVLNSPYKFPYAYGETMTMMTGGKELRGFHCTCRVYICRVHAWTLRPRLIALQPSFLHTVQCCLYGAGRDVLPGAELWFQDLHNGWRSRGNYKRESIVRFKTILILSAHVYFYVYTELFAQLLCH